MGVMASLRKRWGEESMRLLVSGEMAVHDDDLGYVFSFGKYVSEEQELFWPRSRVLSAGTQAAAGDPNTTQRGLLPVRHSELPTQIADRWRGVINTFARRLFLDREGCRRVGSVLNLCCNSPVQVACVSSVCTCWLIKTVSPSSLVFFSRSLCLFAILSLSFLWLWFLHQGLELDWVSMTCRVREVGFPDIRLKTLQLFARILKYYCFIFIKIFMYVFSKTSLIAAGNLQ